MIYMAGSWKREAKSTIRLIIKGSYFKLNLFFRLKCNHFVYDNFQLPDFNPQKNRKKILPAVIKSNDLIVLTKKKLFFGDDIHTH
ncbi:hypothetical protein BOQ64_20750 [Chryseobacterium sp. CH25]|nr:hypothetical protein BOQ64_20750 [Chryseobacterium sp. CH25]